ncbi:MAG: fibronectin type III domain-containing protein [Actinomycetota bacterium]
MGYSCTGRDQATVDVLNALGISPIAVQARVSSAQLTPAPTAGDLFDLAFTWDLTLSSDFVAISVSLGVVTYAVDADQYPILATSGASGEADGTGASQVVVPLGDGSTPTTFARGPFTGTFTRTAPLDTAMTFRPETITLTLTTNSGFPLLLTCAAGAGELVVLEEEPTEPTVTTTSVPPTTSTTVGVPAQPSSVSAIARNGGASVSWNPPATNGGSSITGYVITPQVGYFVLPSRTFSSTATTQTLTGLTNGWPYRFRVAATNIQGSGVRSTASLEIRPGTPSMPTAPVATASSGQATVSWVLPAVDNGSPITRYVITPQVGYFVLPSRTFSSTATTQTLTGLTNGWPYRFRIAAINARGTGAPSELTAAATPT